MRISKDELYMIFLLILVLVASVFVVLKPTSFSTFAKSSLSGSYLK